MLRQHPQARAVRRDLCDGVAAELRSVALTHALPEEQHLPIRGPLRRRHAVARGGEMTNGTAGCGLYADLVTELRRAEPSMIEPQGDHAAVRRHRRPATH